MAAAEVQVRFLVASAEDIPTTGGLDTEMCSLCFALVPVQRMEAHKDALHQNTYASGSNVTVEG
jgi:hypothetical protein